VFSWHFVLVRCKKEIQSLRHIKEKVWQRRVGIKINNELFVVCCCCRRSLPEFLQKQQAVDGVQEFPTICVVFKNKCAAIFKPRHIKFIRSVGD
jgi:hypothetical protein